MRNTTRRVSGAALALEADIYHLHDPELIPVGLDLKKRGKIVIFDAHEDLPKQLLGKPYLHPLFRLILSKIFSIYEGWACQKFDGVVTATQFIRDKFQKINNNVMDINNFPLLGELTVGEIDWKRKKKEVAYVGGITQIRGVEQVVDALEFCESEARLQLVGEFSEKKLESRIKSTAGWPRVDSFGFVDRVGVGNVLSRAVAGLVTFLPAPNHIDAQPNKMFEYMSAGIPVIASNFPLWKEIIEGHNCGLCVDPLDSRAIAEAIDYLVAHPAKAEEMGRNGQCAVHQTYNWAIEETKLLQFYRCLTA